MTKLKKLTEINEREIKFHNELHSKKSGRKENIFYKAIHNMYLDFFNYLKNNTENKNILDFGCGVGSITEQVASQNPSRITGIDISEVSIKKAKVNAEKLKLKIDYKVDNCENSSIESNSFDLIYGSGILHHLKLESSVREINRLLKKGGTMVFMEPLGTNPLINLYRKLTPNSRTSDDHPFVKEDFDFLNKVYNKVTVKYYGFLTLIFFPFYKDPNKSNIYKFIAAIDEIIFRFKFFKYFAWSILIIGKKS